MDFDDFDDITVMARALVDIGCREAAVKATLAEEFPGIDVEAAYDEAVICVVAREVERRSIRRREALAAVASEHDLARSAHDLAEPGRSRRFTR